MPIIPLYPPNATTREEGQGVASDTPHNPLPQLLQTPSGLAILEIQGTINLPSRETLDALGDDEIGPDDKKTTVQTPIGRLSFPDYGAADGQTSDDSWMKRVHLYVGRYQRLTGEVKKLVKPLAVIQRRQADGSGATTAASNNQSGHADELEVVEIVKHKIIFSSRPEPFGDMTTV